MLRGHDPRGCYPTPRVLKKLPNHVLPYDRQAHQNPRVRPIVVCKEERTRVSLEQDIPVEEVHAHCRGRAVFL